MLNVVFCDDDSQFLKRIVPMAKDIFTKLRVDVTLYTCTNADILINHFEQYNPYYDIIFLDIDMPIIDGKEAARRLRLIDKKFKLVFITSFEQEVLNTFQFNVSGFLPKTLINERLFAIIERVVNSINEDNPKIQIFRVNITEDKVILIKVPLNDIMFFESIKRKIYLHTKREIYLLHSYKFADLISKYSGQGFIDIHRTCLVNVQYIFSVYDIEIRLDDRTILPMSRRKKQQVLNRFLEIISEVREC